MVKTVRQLAGGGHLSAPIARLANFNPVSTLEEIKFVLTVKLQKRAIK